MTQYAQLFTALNAPFSQREIKTRPQGSRQLQYITARTVMIRLDEVVGPENWWDEYQPLEHSVICRLTIRLPNGSTITKADAGGNAGMPDTGDDEKSGFSDAFKRAAVKFGIGRHLYGDGVANLRGAPAEPEAKPSPPGRTAPRPGPGTDNGKTAHHAINHDNSTGHGSGAYADPKTVQAYQAFVTAMATEVNSKWLDSLTDPKTGEIIQADGQITDDGDLARHLYGWARSMDWVKAPESPRVGQRDKFTAVAWVDHMEEFDLETRRFCRAKWVNARKKIKAPKPSPQDSEITALAAQDEVLDAILTTEAGARG